MQRLFSQRRLLPCCSHARSRTSQRKTPPRLLMPISLRIFWHSTHRIGRASFCAAGLVLCALWGVVLWGMQNGLNGFAGLIALLVLGHSVLCVLSQRFHDLGRSGWWSWLVLMLIWAMSALILGVTANIAHMAAVFILALVMASLACVPGQSGHNRYGRAPQ